MSPGVVSVYLWSGFMSEVDDMQCGHMYRAVFCLLILCSRLLLVSIDVELYTLFMIVFIKINIHDLHD